MKRVFFVWVLCFSVLAVPVTAESFRVLIAGEMVISAENPEGSSVNLSNNSAAIIRLGSGVHFLRGVELELFAPQAWLLYQGSLAMLVNVELNRSPATGVHDLIGRRLVFNPLPNRLRAVYQIPVRQFHGLRSGPYATVLPGVTLPASFPVLFRLTPIIKGLSEELERMQFRLTAKPILSDEGAVRLNFRFPDQLQDRPFTVLINDILVENIGEERILREGEHHLVVLSEDYRNESRRFMVERARTLDLVINLQDSTPLLIFEAPENAQIFLNNNLIPRTFNPVPVVPGVHEARFQVGDYSITQIINVQRGKTYRIALAVDINIQEHD
jgi:hypothetical protein